MSCQFFLAELAQEVIFSLLDSRTLKLGSESNFCLPEPFTQKSVNEEEIMKMKMTFFNAKRQVTTTK